VQAGQGGGSPLGQFQNVPAGVLSARLRTDQPGLSEFPLDARQTGGVEQQVARGLGR
jgi:hypothetical protein